MNTITINGADNMDKRYMAKRLRRLKEWGAPLHGWHCADVVDVREDDPEAPLSECELCGCGNVRYEHIMEHEEYFEPVTVGCICAGIMEGDILKAKERERLMRNRAKRRRNFVRKAWKQTSRNTRYRQYKGQLITIVENYGSYAVHAGTKTTLTYKGKAIRDFLSASYAAFDLADSVVKLL